MTLVGLGLCPRELQTKPPDCPQPDKSHQLSHHLAKVPVKQCVPGQGVGGQAELLGASKTQGSRRGSCFFPSLFLRSPLQASTQGPVASGALLHWAKSLSLKS